MLSDGPFLVNPAVLRRQGLFIFLRSFSPQRESRALTMRRHGHGNKYSAGERLDRTLRFPFSTTSITHNKGSGFPLRRE